MPVVVAALMGGLLVLAAYAGAGVLAIAVIGAQVVLAYGLTGARGLPDDARSGGLIALSGGGLVLALTMAEPDPAGPSVAPALWVLGPAVALGLLLQLTRRDGRERLTETLSTTISGIALAGLLALVVALETLEPLRADAVALVVAGGLVGVPVWWLAGAGTGRWRWAGAVAALLAVAAGAVAVTAVDIVGLDSGEQAIVGAAAALTGLVGAGAGRQLSVDAMSRAALMPALALALSAPAGYLAVRVLFY